MAILNVGSILVKLNDGTEEYRVSDGTYKWDEFEAEVVEEETEVPEEPVTPADTPRIMYGTVTDTLFHTEIRILKRQSIYMRVFRDTLRDLMPTSVR